MPAATISQLLREFNEKAEKTISHLGEQLASIRTGRSQASLVEHLMVEAYGSNMELIQLATITTPDAKTIVIDPWDKTLVGAIEKAIHASGLGLNPNSDGKTIRLFMPELTEERRQEFKKLCLNRVEDARVALRSLRVFVLKKLKEISEASSLSEDEVEREKKTLQERVDAYNENINEMKAKKEREIMTV